MAATDMYAYSFHLIFLNVYHVEHEWPGLGLLHLGTY